MTLHERNSAHTEEFFKLINFMGNEDDLAKVVGEALIREHRTLQQNAIRFLYQLLQYYDENNTGTDQRNEAAVAWAGKIARDEPEHFPFI